MRRHELDAVSFVAAVVFLAVAGAHIVARAGGSHLDLRWTLPVLLVLLGVLGLMSAVRSARPAEPGDERRLSRPEDSRTAPPDEPAQGTAQTAPAVGPVAEEHRRDADEPTDASGT